MCRRATSAGKNRPTRSISTTCSKRRSECSRNTRRSRRFIGGNSNSSSWMNTRTRTRSRPTSSISLAAEHRNVMVVGDDAQSIYSWRGANFQNILAFPQRYPNAQVFKIEMNYRSVPEILEVANAAIAANVQQFRKQLSATRLTNSAKPAMVALNDGGEQAQFVAQRILELRDEGIELNEIAVLYRAHYHAVELQLELSRRGIPYQITSGDSFFRAGAHQGRRGLHSLRRQPARRSGLQANGQAPAWHRWQERGKPLGATGRNRSTRTKLSSLGASDCSRCRSAPAQKNRGNNWPIRWTRLRLTEPRSRRPR